MKQGVRYPPHRLIPMCARPRNGCQRAQHSRWHKDGDNPRLPRHPGQWLPLPRGQGSPGRATAVPDLTDESGTGFPGCLETQGLALLLASRTQISLLPDSNFAGTICDIRIADAEPQRQKDPGERSGKQELTVAPSIGAFRNNTAPSGAVARRTPEAFPVPGLAPKPEQSRRYMEAGGTSPQ